MKDDSGRLDDRYYSILEDEFDLAYEVERFRQSNMHDLADALERFIAALTAEPPRWEDAKRFGTEVADEAYGHARDFEHFRDALFRALSPLMFDLPETMSDMDLALSDPESKHAHALGAARVVRIFGVNEFV